MKNNLKQPWVIRKLAYLATSIVMVALVVFGVIDSSKADSATATVMDVILPLLAVITTGMAAHKTDSTSDSTVSADDVINKIKRLENSLLSPAGYPEVEDNDVNEVTLDDENVDSSLPVYHGETTA